MRWGGGGPLPPPPLHPHGRYVVTMAVAQRAPGLPLGACRFNNDFEVDKARRRAQTEVNDWETFVENEKARLERRCVRLCSQRLRVLS